MNKSLLTIALIAIISVGLLFRTVNLSSNPPGFSADEAVIGLDAYSLMYTGKDHTGKHLGYLS